MLEAPQCQTPIPQKSRRVMGSEVRQQWNTASWRDGEAAYEEMGESLNTMAFPPCEYKLQMHIYSGCEFVQCRNTGFRRHLSLIASVFDER